MKKVLVLITMIFAVLLSACGSKTKTGLTIDYGSSKLYSHSEMDTAMELVKTEFATWEGCELHSIKYAGDECNSEENIAWMNDLSDDARIVDCMELLSDFHTPKEGDAWEKDKEFTDWQWWLGRTKDGEWRLLTWGY